MSAAFTPGPWQLRIDPYEDDPFPGKDFFVLRLGDDAIQGITEPANARLIAAAPELYEALLLWLAYDDQDEADFAQAGPMLLYARAIDATRSALTKARGGAS